MRAQVTRTRPTFTAQDIENAVTTMRDLHATLKAAQVSYATSHTPATKQAQRAATIAYDNFLSNNRPVLRAAHAAGII